MSPVRFTDKVNIQKTREDFTPRPYGLSNLGLGIVFVAAALVMVFCIFLIAPDYKMTLSFIVTAIMALSFGVTWVVIAHLRDVVMATEFQNALLSKAARSDTIACMILKRDGHLVFSDFENAEAFTSVQHLGYRGLDLLMQHPVIEDNAKVELSEAIRNNLLTTIDVTLDKGSCYYDATITVCPIVRPKGGYLYIKISANSPSALIGHVLEQLSVGSFVATKKGHLLSVNDVLCNLVGKSSEDVIAQTLTVESLFSEFMGGNHEQCWHPQFHGVATLVADDAAKDYYLYQQIDQLGHCFGVVIPFPDSENRKGFTDLSLSGQSSDVVLHAPIGIAVIDQHGIIEEVNTALASILETQSISLVGQPLLQLIASKDHHALTKLFTSDQSELSLEVALASDAEKHAHLLIHIQGKQAIVYMTDITEQKHLELRVAHSQKMQAVGQLAGGIAHDFNNLLTAIIGFCDLLLMRHPAGDSSFADIMQIKQNSNRAANLVKQLLAFSRKQTLQPEPLDVTEVIAELSNLVRRLIGENIEFEVQHGQDLGVIKVDLGQLEQVIINLAVNARDAMPDGGRLVIRTNKILIDAAHPLPSHLIPPSGEEFPPYGEFISIEVEDTGSGISDDIIGQIFDPFFSTKAMGDGTGLGLATVYGIVKQTGAHIFVNSTSGEGTCFTMYVPCYELEDKSLLKVKAEEEEKEKVLSRDLTGSGVILLVEDEAPVRIFSAKALNNKGYTVLEAESGEDALEVVKEEGQNIEVIITDVMMPGMNGPTMIEEVRKTYPDIKVIFISGYAKDAFIKTYGLDQSFNFLQKPYTLKQLATKLKDVKEGAEEMMA